MNKTVIIGLFVASISLAKAVEVRHMPKEWQGQRNISRHDHNNTQTSKNFPKDTKDTQEQSVELWSQHSKNKFFDLEQKTDEAYYNKDFKKASSFFVACALDNDMGETYQDTLYKIDKQSLKWIEEQDYQNLLTILPALEEHLKNKSQNEENAKKSRLLPQIYNSNLEVTFVEIKTK